jgi:hypothetical protein
VIRFYAESNRNRRVKSMLGLDVLLGFNTEKGVIRFYAESNRRVKSMLGLDSKE